MKFKYFILLFLPLLLLFYFVFVYTPKIPIPADDSIIALLSYTSFVDCGLKTIVFENGDGFGFNNDSKESKIIFYSFKLTPAEKEQLVLKFEEYKFFSFPRSRTCNICDPSMSWLMLSTSINEHHSYDCDLFTNTNFSKIVSLFTTLVTKKFEGATEISSIELIQNVHDTMNKMPEKSPKRTMIRLWLDDITHSLMYNDHVDKEAIKVFCSPGDESVLNKESRE